MDIAALSSDFFLQFYIYINGIVGFILMGDGEIYDNNALIEIGLFFFFVKNQCVDPPHLLPMKKLCSKVY